VRRIRRLLARLRPARHECGALRMACDECYRHFGAGWRGGAMDFLVATAIWNFVMTGGRQGQTTYTVRSDWNGVFRPMNEGVGGVVCLECFDKRAMALRVEYRDHVVVFGAGCWMGGTYAVGIPL
jgi:hypothetical protein